MPNTGGFSGKGGLDPFNPIKDPTQFGRDREDSARLPLRKARLHVHRLQRGIPIHRG
jgi:hypothetical protein